MYVHIGEDGNLDITWGSKTEDKSYGMFKNEVNLKRTEK